MKTPRCSTRSLLLAPLGAVCPGPQLRGARRSRAKVLFKMGLLWKTFHAESACSCPPCGQWG